MSLHTWLAESLQLVLLRSVSRVYWRAQALQGFSPEALRGFQGFQALPEFQAFRGFQGFQASGIGRVFKALQVFISYIWSQGRKTTRPNNQVDYCSDEVHFGFRFRLFFLRVDAVGQGYSPPRRLIAAKCLRRIQKVICR